MRDEIEERGKPEITVPDAPATELGITDHIEGSGAEATPASTVVVHYVGVGQASGQEFDSSWSRNDPIAFGLDQVIAGWSQGMVGMKAGGRRELVIPGDWRTAPARRLLPSDRTRRSCSWSTSSKVHGSGPHPDSARSPAGASGPPIRLVPRESGHEVLEQKVADSSTGGRDAVSPGRTGYSGRPSTEHYGAARCDTRMNVDRSTRRRQSAESIEGTSDSLNEPGGRPSAAIRWARTVSSAFSGVGTPCWRPSSTISPFM